jgi:hypothetical protein
MAVPAKTDANQRSNTVLQDFVIRSLARGKPLDEVVELLRPQIFPHARTKREIWLANKALKKKIRAWESTQWFRDALYDASLAQLDLDVPEIFRGVARKAKKGRVDAARLALEVTGRHNPRGGDATPAIVNLNFGGAIPRPVGRPTADLELEAAEETDEADG